MIKFKEDKLKEELQNAPRILKNIVFDFNKVSLLFEIDITITRILGKIKGDSGVHDDYRAVDIRDEHKGIYVYNMDQRRALFHFVNGKYPRTDNYLTCIWHQFKNKDGTLDPGHFHIQIPYAWKFTDSIKGLTFK